MGILWQVIVFRKRPLVTSVAAFGSAPPAPVPRSRGNNSQQSALHHACGACRRPTCNRSTRYGGWPVRPSSCPQRPGWSGGGRPLLLERRLGPACVQVRREGAAGAQVGVDGGGRDADELGADGGPLQLRGAGERTAQGRGGAGLAQVRNATGMGRKGQHELRQGSAVGPQGHS